ncbi:PREDICTED: probable E3 ubiquitin-protein ligase RHG1A [Lupinus angustifolius]|uniref:probable E3 ubiquitin-protein ligase RHG1A n=1 Tax=Lupinus angustifolius TaxID=3871 RepID=UPI00092F8D4F|nr:PREDICTED: probable E3 ubiquitin-protein ligase RHG1A [Lupinus angustifolius]
MNQTTDTTMDQQRRDYFQSEPYIPSRSTNISTSNIRTVVTASGNTTNLDSHDLPDAHDNVMMNRLTQYTSIQNQHNRDRDVSVVPHLFYSGMNPLSSTGALPLPLNHTVSDQLHGSSTSAISGAYKRKNTERNRGNFQHFDASASSSTAPPNAIYSDGAGMMDIASFSMPQRRGNGIPSLVEVGPHGSSWSGSGESIMVPDHNHLIRGNYLGPHFQPAAAPWPEQPLNYNINDGHATAWNQSLPMPYLQVRDVNESLLEDASMGLQMYHNTSSNRSGFRFPHPPPVNPLHHNFHHPTLPMQGMRGHSISFHPPSASYRVPTNPLRSAVIPAQNDFEMGARHLRIAPPAGLRRHRPHRGVMPNATLGHQNLSPMHFFQVDDVALLVDHHRDMRLDIDEMSYEELLALGERIGNVSTGLSEEMITAQMKTKTYSVPATVINLEEVASEEPETASCIICMDEYQNQEKIGILQCGHECHADCLRKWLLVKNVCPICKSKGLILE